MKLIVNIVRILVGVLFIFSGLVKANDPHGLSYKMKEFFEIWNTSLSHGSFFLKSPLISLFEFFHEHSLPLSIFMIAFEIVAGVALLLGWRMKIFSWLLLLLIIFFTFLTGYAFLSRHPDGSFKFTNCGCFGDCIPLTIQTSFAKDIILTILIGFLFYHRKDIKPFFSWKTNAIVMFSSTALSFLIQWYALSYLPPMDCLPFRKGNNISEQMKVPANAIPDSTVITYIYEKDGQRIEFTADKFPADFKTPPYKYIDRYDKVVRKGINNLPAINGLTFTTSSGTDTAAAVFAEPRCVLLFCEDFSTPPGKWQSSFEKLRQVATQKNIPVYIVTSSAADAAKTLANTPLASLPVFQCDYTVIRTAARTNPCVYVLEKGTVAGKWSYRRISSATDYISSVKN